MCIAKRIAKNINQLLNQVDVEHNLLAKEQLRLEQATQDLLHEMELTTFNACEGYYLAKRIKDIRIQRREIKNELNELTALKTFASKGQFRCELDNVVKSIELKEKAKEKALYAPRVLNDIKLCDRGYQKKSKQLQKVNQTNIKFHPEVDKVEQLLAQVQ